MTQKPRRAVAASSERGFIIVAVLWILIALSALATIFSVYLSNSAQALAITDTGLQTEALVSASLELTTYQLLIADDKARPALGSFRFRLDNADVLVNFTSEAARVDLNFASKEILANLFAVLGADEKLAKESADRIVGWRTRPAANAANEEEALYGAAGLIYSPRQSFFTHVNELSLVLGVPPELVDRALPFVTVFSGSPNVDVLIAPPEVIAALPEMTPSALNDFLKQRPTLSRDQAAIAAALGPAQASATIPNSKSFRILTTLRFDNGRRTVSEVVIALGDDKDPYHVLSWQDDVEAGHRSWKLVSG
ncbi:general secretion pathway protein K [mine drainage metagenome]|uniref:General secretion pathway protein K n=1 Tax=mine drainage metagenome TaxID=410659 RepID=A0A1J5PAL6_9ZZZZ